MMTSNDFDGIPERYLLYQALAKVLRCKIKRHILQSKHFDDLYCEVESPGRCSPYLFDVKKHRHKSRKISFGRVEGKTSKCPLDIRKYFEAYLQIKQQIDKPIQELAVWCRCDSKEYEFLSENVHREFIDERNVNDLVETHEIGVRKARLKANAVIIKELMKVNPPLYKLASTTTTLMPQKSVTSSGELSKRFYLLLPKDVFEVENHFKEEFIRPSKNSWCEAKQFHDMFESVLSEQFRRRNRTDFHKLLQMEQEPSSELVGVENIYDKKLYQSEVTWHVDYEDSQGDVQQFLSKLLFYSNAPSKNQLEHVQRFCDKETRNLMEKYCERGILVGSSHLDDFLKLLIKGKFDGRKSIGRISFKADSLKKLEEAIFMCDKANSFNQLIIEASASVHLSVDRIASILEKSSEHFSLYDGANFTTVNAKLPILMNFCNMCQIDWWILIVMDKHYAVSEDFNIDRNCRIITIAPEVNRLHNQKSLFFTDMFNFDDLSDETKDKILSTVVLLQGRCTQLSALLSEQAIATISMVTLSDWSQNFDRQIMIGEEIEIPELDLLIDRNLKTGTKSNIDPFQTTFESLAVLCGFPGSGTSTLLKQMAVSFSEQYDDHIVLLADFTQIVAWFDYSYDVKALILKLIDINSINTIEEFIVQKMIEDHRIMLMLDGFHEINSTKENIAISMIALLRQAKLHLLMIATRPHRLEVLQQRLGDPTVYHILPFTEDDQLQFLLQRSSRVSSNESPFVDNIQTFRSIFDDEHLLNTPLHSAIVAEIYEEYCTERSNDQWRVAEVMQRFIDKKFEAFTDKFFDRINRAHESTLKTLRKTFEADHSELAFRLETNQTIDLETFFKLEPYGLLRIDNNTISFINAIFVDFFVTQYLVHQQADRRHFNLYMSKQFGKSKFNGFLEYHISKADTHQPSLELTPLFQNMNLTELRCLRQYKLHTDKIKQWHTFFVECYTVEQQLDYLRKSIAKAEFNIFQVIYESLPSSLVDEICFKFASSAYNPFWIDLTSTSEEKLLRLLKILHEEHPQDVVRKHISNFNCNEDDFITMAIKRDHQSLTEQLFYIEQNLSEENESDLVQDYLNKRWCQYLRLTAEYGRDALLKQTLGLIAKRFHQRVIKYFLMKHNFLCVLIDAFKDKNVDAEVVQRMLTFIEQHLSDYDLHVLLNRNADGRLFAEKLMDLQNPRVLELCESLRNRHEV